MPEMDFHAETVHLQTKTTFNVSSMGLNMSVVNDVGFQKNYVIVNFFHFVHL